MKHIIALLIKFLMVAVILSIVLNVMTDLTFGSIMYLSVAVTVLAYVLGDLLILSATNNTVATIADIGLVFATVYLFDYLINANVISVWDALVCAVIIGVGEWFFHKYVSSRVLEDNNL
jgi:hypothetical protein